MANDKFILSEFQKAIRRNSSMAVVDLDDSFAHKFDFLIDRFEEVLNKTGNSIPPNRWSYTRIGLLKQGSGEFITGIHKFKAEKNILVVIPSRVITSSKNWTPDTKGYLILFNMNFFFQKNFPHKYISEKKILTHALRPYVFIHDDQAKEVSSLFETILQEQESNHSNKDELIALKVIELLIMSERLFGERQQLETSLPATDIMNKFVDLLEVHFLKERSVVFYASHLHVHPNHLNALIKKQTGFTAKECIQNRLLLEAKYLLHSTNLTIKEISNQIGFEDPNYFAVFFKRTENMSPGAYRSANL